MSDVIYEKKGHVAHITLNRPGRLNAISRGLTRELGKIWADFRDDDGLWVAVLGGEGKSFCAGADIGDMNSAGWGIKQSLLFGEESCAPSRYQVFKPIVAALHGHVIGAGMWLALESDVRIAAEDTVFSLPEVRHNIPVMFAAFATEYIPRGVALEMLLVGSKMDAQRAYQLGLVGRVVPGDELMAAAGRVAEEICQNGPLSVRATKEMLVRGNGLDLDSALALTDRLAAPVFRSDDFREAQRAFLEKRKPEWKLK